MITFSTATLYSIQPAYLTNFNNKNKDKRNNSNSNINNNKESLQ